MTKNSKTWWAEVMAEVNTSYKKYLAANPITRLEIWPEIKSDQKWEQLEQKVSHLLLEALEESLVSEIVASRKVDPGSIIFKVMTVYQPGGIEEKAQLVKDLHEPRVESTTQEAIKVLREWERRRKRAVEVGLVLPDPSIQVKALDTIVQKMLEADSKVQFRVQLTRSALNIDTEPSEEKVDAYFRVLQAELNSMEAISGTKDKVKIKAVAQKGDVPKGDKGGKGKGDGKGKKGKGKGEGKSKIDAPCKWYSSEQGCFRGGDCMFVHGYIKFEEGRCFNCGSKEH